MNLVDQSIPASGAAPGIAADGLLLAELAREERARAALGTVLPHLVGSDDALVLGEELVVRTRAMVAALAQDLLRPLGDDVPPSLAQRLFAALVSRPALLAHCHALALEGRTTERLAQAGLDPLLAPLMESHLAAADRDEVQLAMATLTAQARFTARQRRMEAAANELPGELIHTALFAMGDIAGTEGAGAAAALRSGYDEARTRLGLLSRLALMPPDPAVHADPALDLAAAGFALFATALALRAGVPREEVVVASAPGHEVRMGLLLQAAGLPQDEARPIMALLHPQAQIPPAWLALPRRRATDLLAGARS